jgi:endonuclease YncB( thermonuclease family)
MPQPLLLALTLMVGTLLGPIARAADEPRILAATVTKVNDGDSIEVRTDAGPARVRLSGIDTPEFDQPYSPAATAALRAMLPLGSQVELEVVTRDQFRRLVAVVWRIADGKRHNVNEAMLGEGHAWAYRRYMNEARFCELEAAARERKLGLWSLPVTDWVYPPEWRYLKDGDIRTLPAPYPETLETCLAVHQKAGKGTYEPPK